MESNIYEQPLDSNWRGNYCYAVYKHQLIAPDIAFAMCLQAFAGLWAGEACNIRQEQSPIGSSLKVTCVGNDVRKVEIDITRELPMRSDAVFRGNELE